MKAANQIVGDLGEEYFRFGWGFTNKETDGFLHPHSKALPTRERLQDSTVQTIIC